ncbi:MAG: chalcone isomerase family protein [Candidatus Thiodiazotropha sp. (ex Codakia rugifera)]|nr:chalcone isomerase family protein [Candidatus Thiodiazotropha sp. (ex Codakia rugifera)]
MKNIFIACIFIFCIAVSEAREVAGVSIPDQIVRDADKAELVLNGAGVRKKFFFSVYLASLYLQQPSRQIEAVIDADKPARVQMRILYSKIDKEKFTKGWDDGFSANLSAEQLQAVRQRLDQFNGMFQSLVKGDTIELDYIPGEGTHVTIKGEKKGIVPGGDFYQALLMVWLGESPISQTLKQELLGQK